MVIIHFLLHDVSPHDISRKSKSEVLLFLRRYLWPLDINESGHLCTYLKSDNIIIFAASGFNLHKTLYIVVEKC